jgi:hypothetical protein
MNGAAVIAGASFFAMPSSCTIGNVNVRTANPFPALTATLLKGNGFVAPSAVSSCAGAPCTIAANQAFNAGDSFAVTLDAGGAQLGTTSGGLSVEFSCQ